MTPEERAKKYFVEILEEDPEYFEDSVSYLVDDFKEAQREAVEWTVRLVEHQYHRCSSLMNGHEVFQKALRELTPEKILGNAYERKTPL